MLQLTSSQLNAVAAFKAFLDGPAQVFVLRGAAGTGKTTLVAEFLRYLAALNRESVLMAPTGRAAYIIAQKTRHAASTIHRAIYSLKVIKSASGADGADTGLHAQFALRSNDDRRDTVYFVDEASMVSDKFNENEAFSFGSGRLLSDLFSYADGRKIVFVGDHAQLPPVDMNFSPALDEDYFRTTFGCTVTGCTLREVMRQSDGSVMLANATRLRQSIEDADYAEFTLASGSDTKRADAGLLDPYYALSADKPCPTAAIITYSNRQALEYNIAVRRHYFGADAPRLLAGDMLMVARNNYAYGHELFNGNIVLVKACENDVMVHNVNVKLDKERSVCVPLRFRKVTIAYRNAEGPATLDVILLDNFLDDPHGAIDSLTARALRVDFEKRLPSKIKDALPSIRKAITHKAPLTHDQQEIYADYIRLLLNDPFYNALIAKYGYAMTCHKAQGGEWKNVFVDMFRYGGTANENYFRWAYTALTRASGRLWHFRSPDYTYISRMTVEPIQRSGNIRTSIYTAPGSDFRKARFERIEALASRAGLTVTDDLSKDYQHRVTFTDTDGHRASYILWYKAKGYSDRVQPVSCDCDELHTLADTVLADSLAPVDIPFTCPERPFAEKLAAHLKAIFAELDIRLLDITHDHYQDVFHVQASGLAKIGLYYNDKGIYTYMKLASSLGADDAKLEAFRQKFV